MISSIFVIEILKSSEFLTNKMDLRTCEFFIFAYWNRENKTQQIIVSPKIVQLSTNKVIKMTARFLVSELWGPHWLKECEAGAGDDKELYLHDHTSTYSIAKAIFRNQNYIIGQLPYLIKKLEEFISSLIKPFIGIWVIFGIRILTL